MARDEVTNVENAKDKTKVEKCGNLLVLPELVAVAVDFRLQNFLIAAAIEGIRTLEIPAPYYSDRLRRQIPPSSRVLTLALSSPLPLHILAILVLHILSLTQC